MTSDVSLSLRPDTFDEIIARDVLERGAYDLTAFPVYQAAAKRCYHSIIDGGKRPFILDLGAHIGSSTVYFAARWPGSHIVSVEPAPDNLVLLRKNAEAVGATVLAGAVGGENGHGTVIDADGKTCGYQVHADGNGPRCDVFAIWDIVEACPDDCVPFIAKIDIEGSEKEIFAGARWADRFPIVACEIHDYLHVGKGVGRNFLQWCVDDKRDVLVKGDVLFGVSARALGI